MSPDQGVQYCPYWVRAARPGLSLYLLIPLLVLLSGVCSSLNKCIRLVEQRWSKQRSFLPSHSL